MHSPFVSALLLFGVASASASALPDVEARWGGGGGKQPCSEAVVALATGIHINIIGQYAEYNSTLNVQKIEQTYQRGAPFFVAQGQLLGAIQGGMNIRLFNQEIAPPGNPAIPGLAQYEAAQQQEQHIALTLTGNYNQDKSQLEQLLTDIKNGIQLNMNNLKNATSQCEFTLQFPPADQMGQ